MNMFEKQMEVLEINVLEEEKGDGGELSLPGALRYLDIYMDENAILGCREHIKEDWEYEKDTVNWINGGLEMDEYGHPTFIPGYLEHIEENSLDVSMACSSYCWSAENPVTEDIATINDRRTSLLMVEAPIVSYYPVFVQNKRKLREWIGEELVKYGIRVAQKERVNTMLSFIVMSSKEKVKKARAKFFSHFFSFQENGIINWSKMASEWINISQYHQIKEAFNLRMYKNIPSQNEMDIPIYENGYIPVCR